VRPGQYGDPHAERSNHHHIKHHKRRRRADVFPNLFQDQMVADRAADSQTERIKNDAEKKYIGAYMTECQYNEPSRQDTPKTGSQQLEGGEIARKPGA